MSKRRFTKGKTKRWILFSVAYLFAVLMVLPTIYTISSSFKSINEIFMIPIQWIPKEIHWENFTHPFQQRAWGRYFLNSFVVAAAVTSTSLLFSSLAGYSLAKFSYPGRSFLFLVVLTTLMIPIEVTMVPLYLVVKDFGWLNSYRGLIIPCLMTPFAIFWMRQYILTIPDDFANAARVDGAGEFLIFLRVILPMCKPALGALAIFEFVGSWNSFIWPLVIISKDELRTIPVGLVTFEQAYGTVYNELFAMSLLSILPVSMLFVFLRKRFMEGISLGGLK